MSAESAWKRRFRLGHTRTRVEEDVDEELRAHMEGLVERYVRGGLPEEEARERARSECESLFAARPELAARAWRRQRRGQRRAWLDGLLQDAGTSLRQMRRRPGFTAVVLLILGLGIGANSATFSMVRAVVLAPLPYPEPDRLVTVWTPWEGDRFNPVSALDWADLKERSRSFQAWGAYSSEPLNLSGDGLPVQVQGVRASAGVLRALAVRPVEGRVFLPEETRFPTARVAVIGHGLRERRFGSDPDVVGRTLLLNQEPWTVVGVLPRDFRFPDWTGLTQPDVYLPLTIDPASADRGSYYLNVVGRLAEGRTLEQAREELSAIAADLAAAYPETNGHREAQVVPLGQIVLGDVSGRLWTLLAVSGLVLLLSCANVGGLLVARNLGRRVEVAIRASLGAGRARLTRQLLTEVLTLSLLAGGVGLAVAWLGTGFLASLLPPDLLRGRAPRVDGLVLSVTFAATLMTAVLAGTFPALVSSATTSGAALREGAHAVTLGRSRARLLRSMVVVQFALAFVLVNVAVLMAQSLREATGQQELEEPGHVLVAGYLQPGTRNAEIFLADPFLEELLRRVRSLPGVRAAGATTTLPLRGRWSSDLLPEGREYDPDVSVPSTQMVPVSPGYFEAMGIALLEGRDLTASDRTDVPVGVVVNEAFAARSWSDQDPLGKTLRDNAPAHFWLEAVVVGVVENVRERGLEHAAGAAVYLPFFPSFQEDRWVAVRTVGDPLALVPAFRETLSDLDPDRPVVEVLTGEGLYGSMARGRFATMQLFGLFALIALALAAAGDFGVMSFIVGQRLREIGVRVALGASRREVVGSVMGEALKLVMVGTMIGLLGAWGASGVIQGLLFRVRANDPAVMAVAGLILGLTAVVATGLPAWRASRADPVEVMRAG